MCCGNAVFQEIFLHRDYTSKGVVDGINYLKQWSLGFLLAAVDILSQRELTLEISICISSSFSRLCSNVEFSTCCLPAMSA
jgi:hypothetical protein